MPGLAVGWFAVTRLVLLPLFAVVAWELGLLSSVKMAPTPLPALAGHLRTSQEKLQDTAYGCDCKVLHVVARLYQGVLGGFARQPSGGLHVVVV